jgi:hypothetical protein
VLGVEGQGNGMATVRVDNDNHFASFFAKIRSKR